MIQVIQFILALSLLIVLHEFGHYFFARLFKTRVEKFYLFFDFLFPFSNILPFSLFKKKVGETTWGIGWFPLGGYVKIAGMVDESMDKEQMAKPPEPWEFRSKKPYQRLLIMLGGIIVNVLLAFILYCMISFVWGQKRLPISEVNAKGGIMVADSLGYKLGFRDGDKIKSINNEPIQYFDEIRKNIFYARTVQIERDGKDLVLSLPEDLPGQIVDSKSSGLVNYSLPAIIGKVNKGSNAEKAGLKPEDRITAINGTAIANFSKMKPLIDSLKGREVNLSVLRDGKSINVSTMVSDSGSIGIAFLVPEKLDELGKAGIFNLETKEYTFAQSIPAGYRLAVESLTSYVKQFKLLGNIKSGAFKGLGGFDSIRRVYSTDWDWHHFWSVTAFLSIVLAFMNLLPIPGLDGGYVVFTLIEMVTGRKVNEKVMEVATTIGLVLLLILMVGANANDIIRNFFSK